MDKLIWWGWGSSQGCGLDLTGEGVIVPSGWLRSSLGCLAHYWPTIPKQVGKASREEWSVSGGGVHLFEGTVSILGVLWETSLGCRGSSLVGGLQRSGLGNLGNQLTGKYGMYWDVWCSC